MLLQLSPKHAFTDPLPLPLVAYEEKEASTFPHCMCVYLLHSPFQELSVRSEPFSLQISK